MFTGIIESLGKVKSITKEGSNVHFGIEADIVNELRIDQSVAHDGVCLTVTEIKDGLYFVTAIDETLKRSSLSQWKEGSLVNIERCMPSGGRFDGHIVQGHVDQTGVVEKVETLDGSWKIFIKYDPSKGNITVEKGSISLNGVSLTVVDSGDDFFSVAIIPYTWEHTNFQNFKAGDKVNLEFDIIGKYIQKVLAQRNMN